jgi:NAD(P)-dependent dehydrogenase (short-subunit alcohol dehydrogenase family)
VRSISGSLGIHLDAAHWFYQMKPYTYSASKSALNQFPIFLAHALKDTAMKVNATNPGWVQTAIGSDQAPLTPAEGTRSSVALALLPADCPSGTFTEAGETLPWQAPAGNRLATCFSRASLPVRQDSFFLSASS